MKHTIIILLLTTLILSLTGCRFNFMEPEEMQEFLDGVHKKFGGQGYASLNSWV